MCSRSSASLTRASSTAANPVASAIQSAYCLFGDRFRLYARLRRVFKIHDDHSAPSDRPALDYGSPDLSGKRTYRDRIRPRARGPDGSGRRLGTTCEEARLCLRQPSARELRFGESRLGSSRRRFGCEPPQRRGGPVDYNRVPTTPASSAYTSTSGRCYLSGTSATRVLPAAITRVPTGLSGRVPRKSL